MSSNPMQMIQQMLGNPQRLGQDYASFARSVSGDPQQIVMEQVKKGAISQQQLTMAQQIAPMIANALHIKL